ncbi:MAG: NTP transferase domain-containing protein [Clostridia bacterium]|nr:NTP transferase domain-containing protein [Clostridia bacterium]
MNKIEFDILVAAEKNGSVDIDALSLASGRSADELTAAIDALTSGGLLAGGAITEAGLEALEPYRTKRAIFIAAGFGSRLRPVTYERPKPLVKVNGTRIIDTLIDGAMAAGIKEIYVVCGYLGEQFSELKEKYPDINLVTNHMYTEANNISSVYLLRDHLKNTYISEADLLLHNKGIFDKYIYQSVYLGIPTSETDDWYFKTNDEGVINELGIGATDCYRMLGISYWDEHDGATLPAHIEATFNMPGGKDEDWCYVPLVSFKDHYKVRVRECKNEDIQEIDTFEELCEVDPGYNSYRK